MLELLDELLDELELEELELLLELEDDELELLDELLELDEELELLLDELLELDELLDELELLEDEELEELLEPHAPRLVHEASLPGTLLVYQLA